jgi:hypothetical protein
MLLSIVVFAFVVIFAPPARIVVGVLRVWRAVVTSAIAVVGCCCRSH